MELYRALFNFNLSVNDFVLGTFSTYDKAYDAIVKDIIRKYETRCDCPCKYFIKKVELDVPDDDFSEFVAEFDDFASDPKKNTKYIYANEMERRRFKERW